jgi:Rieske Fe-S protein
VLRDFDSTRYNAPIDKRLRMAQRRETAVFVSDLKRRRVLQACCGFALGARAIAQVSGGDESLAGAPAAGDGLAFAYGDRAGQPIAPADVVLGAKQILAYPLDPATRRMRDGSRLNQLIVVRLDPARLSAETLARAADGIVAYSGVCTHTGCDVTDWYADALRFKCPCHESEFDPADGARVVGGPAPWQLAALPLATVADTLVVAGSWQGRVGFQPPGLEPFGQ